MGTIVTSSGLNKKGDREMRKVWDFLSGKKTIISAILKGLADVLTVAGQPEAAQLVDQLGNVLLVVGLTHKGVKGVKG